MMSTSSFSLPPLILFNDYDGDWDAYLDALYEWFKNDFIDAKPLFRGRRLGLKRHPMTNGKEATFWHMIQEGPVESERIPNLRRCERIRWPKPIIENSEKLEIKVWCNERNGERRICLWFVRDSYLVILADRKDYLLPWTAYPVDQPHRQRKLQKEYEEYCKKNGSQES
jgi:hypothetical protein